MRKLMLIVGLVMSAAVARANVITNTVVIVSNIYNNVYSEHIVTQKVQNTHYEYYFTNNVYTVSNVTLLVSKTNQTVYLDVGRSFVIAASNEANRASESVTDAQGYASQSAGSASAAASSASSASSYANQAASQRSAAASECATALQTINNRIAWFDEHSGETITQVNINTNFYMPNHIIDRGNYIVDLSTMSMSVAGGKNIKLRFYMNWSAFNYPACEDIGFVRASNVGGLSVHYGIGDDVDISENKSYTHLYVDDIYWTNDGYWNAKVHWRHNTISGAYGSGYYRGAGPAYPPNKYNPNSLVFEGQITLTLVSQEVSSSTYNRYLGNSFYLWRDKNDTSTPDVLPVVSFVTDEDLKLSISSLSNWVENVFQKR